ncbi:MAG: hypothetical protein NTU80_10665 [Verrucomicrobia bacterium]|nr:hypothetical protein [Verrucomicrobiota bacterium]
MKPAPKLPARLLLAALLTLAAAPATLRAQPAPEPAKKEFLPKTTAALAQLQKLSEAKNYSAALALIQPLAAEAPPGSYDAYVLNQIQTQLLLAANRLADAIPTAERALGVSDANPNFGTRENKLELIHLLGQLHYQQALEKKLPAEQVPGLTQALAYAERWLTEAPRATADAQLFAASLLYQLGTLDPARPDSARLRDTIAQAGEGLLLSGAKIHTQLRLLQVAAHLALGETAPATELLELVAEADPVSTSTWSQLVSLYLARAAEVKNPAESERLHLRALHALDRAQAAGQLKSPRDHYTRVAVFFNLHQYSRAAALLEKGLADATLENTRRNWELLASAYQQTDREKLALDALDRAVARFPADANLEFTLAQSLYQAGQVEAAYARGQSAAAKGTLEKPGSASLYLAYLAYELQRYDEAAKWAELARADGGVPAATLDPLIRAVDTARRERAANLRG